MSIKEEEEGDYMDMTRLVFGCLSFTYSIYMRISLLSNGNLTHMVYLIFFNLCHVVLSNTLLPLYFSV